jgi:Conserved protein/domain typically associated with flavoprotein oxygenases, DIM6/NTAB family
MMPETFREIAPCPLLAPVPSVMIGVQREGGKPNLITLAWVGTVCSHPPMVSISVRKSRYSHPILMETREFTINLVSRDLARAMDFCGVKSGHDVDKFAALNLTAIPAAELERAPAVNEAPAYLSCKVKTVLELGSHDVFISEIVGVRVQDKYFDSDGSMHLERAELIAYNHGVYQHLTGVDGFFGFSLAAPKVYENRMKKIRGRKV